MPPLRHAGRGAPLALVVPAVLVAAYGLATLAAPGLGAPFLADRFATLFAPTAAHLFFGPFALAAGALQFNARIRATRPVVHRRLGWVYAASVLVSGIGGLLMAFVSDGGAVTHWGFGVLAVGWLATTAAALRAILRGDTATHERWMRRSYAFCFGAVTLRILLPLLIVTGLSFGTAYRVVSWASWLVNLAAVEWWLRRQAVAGSHA
ncbi:MAG: DUF2306 domain-containing protein [Vicinamibacterales bacterium]